MKQGLTNATLPGVYTGVSSRSSSQGSSSSMYEEVEILCPIPKGFQPVIDSDLKIPEMDPEQREVWQLMLAADKDKGRIGAERDEEGYYVRSPSSTPSTKKWSKKVMIWKGF